MALYNNAKGGSHSRLNISIEEARKLIEQQGYFGNLYDKILNVNLSKIYLSTWLYNRDNGEGCAEATVEELRKNKQVTDPQVEGCAKEHSR